MDYSGPKVPLVVCESILASFTDGERILCYELAYSPLMGCWHFHYAGMFVGVEPDGYIHT